MSRGDELAPIRPTRQILPASGPRPGADLDVELVEQVLAHGGFVDAVGHADRVQRPEPLAFAAAARERPSVASAVDERAMIALVPRPPRLEPFFFDDRQRFVRARRRASTTSCGDTCGAASSPRAAPDRSRSCGTSRAARARAARRRPAPGPTARRGTSACSCSTASMPHAPTSSG